MAQRPVVCALRRKLAELKGDLAYDPKADREAVALAVERVGAVLLMFSPAEDLAKIRALRPWRSTGIKWRPEALTILRTADRPLAARELARMVMERIGAPDEHRVMKSIENSLHVLLARLEGRGLERVGERPKRWAVNP